MSPLPEHKRDDDALRELRMRNAFMTRPPVQQVRALALGRVWLFLLYLVCLVGGGLVIGKVFEVGLICGCVALLLALWVFCRKPRSRHHASLIVIISLLVLVFGTVYYLEQLEALNYDPQGPIGY